MQSFCSYMLVPACMSVLCLEILSLDANEWHRKVVNPLLAADAKSWTTADAKSLLGTVGNPEYIGLCLLMLLSKHNIKWCHIKI